MSSWDSRHFHLFWLRGPSTILREVVLEIFFILLRSQFLYGKIEKRIWCPNGELIFTYNITSKSALTLLPRNIEIRDIAPLNPYLISRKCLIYLPFVISSIQDKTKISNLFHLQNFSLVYTPLPFNWWRPTTSTRWSFIHQCVLAGLEPFPHILALDQYFNIADVYLSSLLAVPGV